VASRAGHTQSAGIGEGVGAWAPPGAQLRVDLTQPADATDFMQAITANLNGAFDQYLAVKNKFQNDFNIQFSMPFSVFGQWGTPKGGPGIAEIVYAPAVIWTPFTNTAIGSGALTFSFQENQFWTHANSESQRAGMGLLAEPNDWAANGYQYAQITYTLHSRATGWPSP
jgi:hypothetical protein